MSKLLSNQYMSSILYSIVCIAVYSLGFSYESSYLKAFAFSLIFFQAISFSKVSFIPSLLIFTLALQLNSSFSFSAVEMETTRVFLFSLSLSLLKNIIPSSLLLCCLWLVHLTCPSLTIDLIAFKALTLELMTLSLLLVIFNKSKKSLFAYQNNLIVLSLSLLLFFILCSLDYSDMAISRLSLFSITSLLFVISLSSAAAVKFSKDFKNISEHIELAVTPDSSFLVLSLKPALAIKEFERLKKSLKGKAKNITSLRRESSHHKTLLSSYQSDLQAMSLKLKDLEAMTNSISTGLLVLDRQGTVTFINKRFYEIFEIEITDVDLMHYKSFINSKTLALETIIEKATDLDFYGSFELTDLEIKSQPWEEKILFFVDVKKDESKLSDEINESVGL